MIEKYLNKKELELYNFLQEKRQLKKQVLEKKKELELLQKEYNKYSDVEFAKKEGVTKQRIFTRRSNLSDKIKRIQNGINSQKINN